MNWLLDHFKISLQLQLSIFAAYLSQIRNEPIKCDSDLTTKFLNKHMDTNDHDDRLDEKLCLFRYISHAASNFYGTEIEI